MLESLKNLSINDLMGRLHRSISAASENVGRLTEKNREIPLAEIIELRNHIRHRLGEGEERLENQKLLKLVELFKEDKNALELIKIDLDEWVEFLDALKENLDRGLGSLSKDEVKEIDKLRSDITRIQAMLRKP